MLLQHYQNRFSLHKAYHGIFQLYYTRVVNRSITEFFLCIGKFPKSAFVVGDAIVDAKRYQGGEGFVSILLFNINLRLKNQPEQRLTGYVSNSHELHFPF